MSKRSITSLTFPALLSLSMFFCIEANAAGVAVIPLGGAVGNAVESDVLKGKTFSTSVAKGLTGTLELQPESEIFTNTIGMQFSLIPAGAFVMGSPAGTGDTSHYPLWPLEIGRDSDEDQHIVILTEDYYMQTTEVTQGQWREVMGNNPSNFSECGDNCPVENVSWNDAQSFISALNTLEGKTNCGTTPNNCYSLPTEAQWEYAARGGTITAFYSGDIIAETGCSNTNLDPISWYDCNADLKTHPVGQKEPNNFGLYDTSGNVYEWCLDWHGAYPADSSPIEDPTGPVSGTNRIVRGGAFSEFAEASRSADRGDNQLPTATTYFTGFRVALSPDS